MKTHLLLEVLFIKKTNQQFLIEQERLSPEDFKSQIRFSKKGDDAKIVLFGPKGGESDIFKKNDSGLLKSLTDRFKNTLGPKGEDIIAEDNKSIREEKQLRGRKELPPITNEPMMRRKI